MRTAVVATQKRIPAYQQLRKGANTMDASVYSKIYRNLGTCSFVQQSAALACYCILRCSRSPRVDYTQGCAPQYFFFVTSSSSSGGDINSSSKGTACVVLFVCIYEPNLQKTVANFEFEKTG